MRFLTIYISLAACANLASAINFLAPLQCLKMKDAAENIDVDRAIDMWTEIACNRCQTKLSDYQSVLRDKFAVPWMETEAQSMGTPELAPHYIALLDSLVDAAKNQCGATDATNLCQDPSYIKSLAHCIQNNGWALTLRNLPTFLPILMSNPCAKQLDYLANPDLLDTIIPGYLTKYVESC